MSGFGIAATLLAVAAGPAPLPAQPPAATLHAGDAVPLVTTVAVSSRSAAVGDRVALSVADDVRVAGRIVIPRGTPAVGEVAVAQAKGAFGQSGKLALRPLYLTLGERIVRLDGGGGAHGTVTAGGVIGLIALTPGFTGRSAILAVGTIISAVVLRDTTF